MNDVLDAEEKQVSGKKVYGLGQIIVGTFLGGPLVTGYFFTENFKAFNRRNIVGKTWAITIMVTVVIFGGIFLIPDTANIPSFVIPMTYTAIAYGLFKQNQEADLQRLLSAGGREFGWGRVIGIGILGLVVTMVVVLGIVFGLDFMGISI